MDNNDITAELKTCQAAAHQWSAANQVEFDASKYKLFILQKCHGQGGDLRLLGSWIDVRPSLGPKFLKIIAGDTNPKTQAFCGRNLSTPPLT